MKMTAYKYVNIHCAIFVLKRENSVLQEIFRFLVAKSTGHSEISGKIFESL